MIINQTLTEKYRLISIDAEVQTGRHIQTQTREGKKGKKYEKPTDERKQLK